jgi:hypothetical protein
MFLLFFYKHIFSRSSLVLVSGLFSGFVLWLVFNVLPHSAASFQTVHKKYLPPVLTGHFPRVLKNYF